jgi:hypothetical protein
VQILGVEKVTWYHSSPRVRRGFCSICGCSLFFDPCDRDWLGISMGAFDGATGTHTELHIFVAEQGDYYEITDDLPKYQSIPRGKPAPACDL